MEGKGMMTDKEKFEGFKSSLIKENEEAYGQEARALYGDHFEESNNLIRQMDPEAYNEMETLNDEMLALFKLAFDLDDPSSDEAQMACGMHKKWLQYYWSHYSKEAHLGLVEMYVADSRFSEYYDKIKKGLALFIRDAMKVYLK